MKSICRICLIRICSILSVLPLLITAGCWSSVELNDITFVRGMLVDKTSSGIELTLDMPLPNRLIPGSAGGTGSQEGEPYTFVSQKGNNMTEALRKIQVDLSRKISFGQLRVIVIGREMAEAGVEPVLEFTVRQPSAHLSSILFITPGKAKEISKIPPIFERFPTDIFSGYMTQAVTIRTTVKDFLMPYYDGGDQVVPLLTFSEKRIESEKVKDQAWMGIGGAAIFRQGKMVDTLSMDEMRGGMWVMGKIKETIVNVISPTDGKNISFTLRNIHTVVNPRIAGKQISLHITAKGNAVVLTSDSEINLKDYKQLKLLEKHLNLRVKELMSNAIDKTRESKVDAFNLGSYIDWHYPKKWKAIQPNWREQYSKGVNVETQGQLKIIGLGTSKLPTVQVPKDMKKVKEE